MFIIMNEDELQTILKLIVDSKYYQDEYNGEADLIKAKIMQEDIHCLLRNNNIKPCTPDYFIL